MTMRGEKELSPATHRKIARLMQLHYETNPNRLAQRLGVSAKHIRAIWSQTDTWQMPPISQALELLAEPERSAYETDGCAA